MIYSFCIKKETNAMKNNLSCSELTKRKIAASLKELMESTPFEKLTVSDITNHCDIHRQTFYYHFQDRYELLDWLLYNEIVKPLISDFNVNNMYQKFCQVFETMYKNKKFYQNALKINPNDLSKYISRIATEEFTQVMKKIGARNGVTANDDESLIIAEFFGYGMSGVVINWASRGMRETPDEMTNRIEKLIEACKIVANNN